MSEQQIKQEIAGIKSAYKDDQTRRAEPGLPEIQRRKITAEQISRVARLKALGGLLNQRFAWN